MSKTTSPAVIRINPKRVIRPESKNLMESIQRRIAEHIVLPCVLAFAGGVLAAQHFSTEESCSEKPASISQHQGDQHAE